MPRSGGDGRDVLRGAADADFSWEVATVTTGKPGRTCAQQQKQSSSCGGWSLG